ncbi:MAG: hypothetical protein RR897_20545, partial [Pseudomonas sp.]
MAGTLAPAGEWASDGLCDAGMKRNRPLPSELVKFCAIFRDRDFSSQHRSSDMQAAKPLFDYPKYWAECFGPAPFLPMSREEMDQLGWDS